MSEPYRVNLDSESQTVNFSIRSSIRSLLIIMRKTPGQSWRIPTQLTYTRREAYDVTELIGKVIDGNTGTALTRAYMPGR